MTFQEVLTEAFARRMDIKPGDSKFALVKEAADLLGNVNEPEAFAEKIISKFLEFCPSEVVDHGAKAINVFLNIYSYTQLKQNFLITLLLCNPDK